MMDTVNQAKLDTLAKRIGALLALAEDGAGATPEEAATAAAKAQELMLKYNLDLSRVQAAKNEKAEYVTERITLSVKAGPYIRVHRDFLTSLANRNFCRALSYRSSNTCVLIGQRHNIGLVREMYVRLAVEIAAMADAAWSGLPAHTRHWENGVAWKRAFFIGATNTIDRRLRQERQAAEAATSADGERVRALVVLTDQELRDAVARLFPKTISVGPTRVRSNGYTAGKEAAENIALRKRAAIEG